MRVHIFSPLKRADQVKAIVAIGGSIAKPKLQASQKRPIATDLRLEHGANLVLLVIEGTKRLCVVEVVEHLQSKPQIRRHRNRGLGPSLYEETIRPLRAELMPRQKISPQFKPAIEIPLSGSCVSKLKSQSNRMRIL